MARSKSLKVQNQLNDNNVKCNRMLIKGCDHLTEVELFYSTDYTLVNESNNQQTTPGLNAFVNSPPSTKQQFQKQLMNSIQRRLNMKSNNNLDKLKLELENNLKKDNLNHDSTSNQPTTNVQNGDTLSTDCSPSTDERNQEKNSTNSDLQSNQTNYHLNGSSSHNSTEPNHLNAKSINCEIANAHQHHNRTANKKLFTRNNSTGIPSQIDDNWLLNSKSTHYDQHFQTIEQPTESNVHSIISSNNNSTMINSINTVSTDSTTILSGHLNELCTKSYWLFTCVNWKRRFCILEEHQLIIKSSNCQDSQTSATIRLENYECSPVKLAKISKRTANVFALHYSTENTPTSLLDFQYTFAANNQTEMFKWIDRIRKAIGEARNDRKASRKKSKDVNDVQLDSVEKTKTLEVVKRPKGPRNRRLPKRQPVKEQNEISDQTPQLEIDNDKSHPVEQQTNATQFKLNLNELNNHRLKSKADINKSTEELEQKNGNKENKLISDESSSKQNLSKIKLRAKSMSDDLLDVETNIDKTTHTKLIKQNTIDCNIVKVDDDTSPSITQSFKRNEPNRTEFSNVKQRREQLIQQLKQIDQTKSKCKSMVSLNQTSSSNEFDISSKPSFQLLKPTLKNRFEFNRSSTRLNAAESSSKLDSPVNEKLNFASKVVSLNSLNTLNNSTSNLNGVEKISSVNAAKSTTLPAHLNSNQLQQTKELSVNSKVSTLNSNKSNTINSNSNYSTAISRNNSTSSSSSSANSNNLSGPSSTTDGQVTHSTAEASKLKKKIQNKKALNSKFYVHLDDEAVTESANTHFSTRLSSVNQLNRNRPVANRASLNLNNNNEIDELTKKFIEKGLSESVNNLRLLPNEELHTKNRQETNENENRRSLSIEKTSSELMMPTYV